MSSSINEPIWAEFLVTWPIERLRTMTLPEYTSAGGKDSFVFWLESRLDKLGSIWGGSAFKFGIYSRNATTVEEGGAGRAYDANYGWYQKFGKTSAEAFEAVRAQVLRVAESARAGRFEEIDKVPLGNTYKWKIAFHYQEIDAPTISCIFQRKPLLVALDMPLSDRQTPLSALYRRVGAQRPPDEPIVAFSKRLWTIAALSTPFELRLPAPAVRKGTFPFSLGAAPFPATMHGGATEAEAGQTARFRTDTGLTFESDVRAISEGKGVLRRRLGDYYAQIGAVPNTTLVISPQPDGSFLIERKGSAPQAAEPPVIPPHVVPSTVATPTLMPPPMRKARPPLNQIFFGPPGTGKTYHTIDKALEILDPTFLQTNRRDRAALKRRYDELSFEGLIRFVSFHQSFSYEDFVEGLRAESDSETGALRYEVADGVFKRLCESAQIRVVQDAPAPIDLTGRRIWKLSLGDATTQRYVFDECVQNGYALLGWGAGADYSTCDTKEDIRRTMEKAGESYAVGDYPIAAIDTFVHVIKRGDLIVVTEGNKKFRAIGEVTGDYRYLERDNADTFAQCRDVRWLRVYGQSVPYEDLMSNFFMQKALYELRDGSIDFVKLRALLAPVKESLANLAPRVLIIDEINRGNVSRIFGELITLIEPSKRAGAAEAIEVTLPYSKQKFSVPGNVHLIGTMNTADRSLAGLDVALRRRFQFIEMPPHPDLLAHVTIAGVSISTMLAAMNQRIEVLLDREHQLGHAYFMELVSSDRIDALADVFRYEILPLLQEYFFEDWERIAWVLNDHRKPDGSRFVVQQSANSGSLFGANVTVDIESKLWRINVDAFANPDSYRGIVTAGAA